MPLYGRTDKFFVNGKPRGIFALKAEQAKITAEANGQANVMTAKYE